MTPQVRSLNKAPDHHSGQIWDTYIFVLPSAIFFLHSPPPSLFFHFVLPCFSPYSINLLPCRHLPCFFPLTLYFSISSSSDFPHSTSHTCSPISSIFFYHNLLPPFDQIPILSENLGLSHLHLKPLSHILSSQNLAVHTISSISSSRSSYSHPTSLSYLPVFPFTEMRFFRNKHFCFSCRFTSIKMFRTL